MVAWRRRVFVIIFVPLLDAVTVSVRTVAAAAAAATGARRKKKKTEKTCCADDGGAEGDTRSRASDGDGKHSVGESVAAAVAVVAVEE